MDLQAIRRAFPVTERWIYFNHAAVAPVSRAVAAAMAQLVGDVRDNGIVHIESWYSLYGAARQSVATLIGARARDIAFVKNTTDGILLVANGVEWSDGDNAVIGEGEFPANVYPWLNLERRGVQVRWVPLRQGRLLVDDFAAAIDARTRVLTVSSVEFHSGFRNDLASLGQLCRERGVLFVVDGIQSVGALAMDVEALGVQCLAADGHKWLMGPEGCALFYCSPAALDRLQVTGLGWAGVAQAQDFLHIDTTLQADARRFETGTQNTAGIAGLRAAIDLLLASGVSHIEARVLELTSRLCEGLERRRYRLLSPRGPGESSGIVTFDSPEHDSTELERRLRESGVVATERGGCVRLSPHFYNTESEVDAVLASLP